MLTQGRLAIVLTHPIDSRLVAAATYTKKPPYSDIEIVVTVFEEAPLEAFSGVLEAGKVVSFEVYQLAEDIVQVRGPNPKIFLDQTQKLFSLPWPGPRNVQFTSGPGGASSTSRERCKNGGLLFLLNK